MADTTTTVRRHSCRGVIERSLQDNPGVLKVSVDRDKRKLLLDFDPAKIEAEAVERIARTMTPDLDHMLECPLWVAKGDSHPCLACLRLDQSKAVTGNIATVVNGNLTLFLPPSPYLRIGDVLAGAHSISVDFEPKQARSLWGKFWNWYNQNLMGNTIVAAVLFTWQLFHLYWLTADVVAMRLFNRSFMELQGFWHLAISLVDYTEIPAIFAISLVYINELRQRFNYRSILFLLFLNSQWLHIFWITDEFVVERLTGGVGLEFPIWLAWIAIGIDYLELPVIYDTIKKSILMILEKSGVRKRRNAQAGNTSQE